MHAIELRIAARDAEQPEDETGAPVQHEVERPRDPRGRWVAPPLIAFSRRALQFSTKLNGRVIHENAISGVATQRLVASGYVMAHAFGVSSPKTTWRKDTAATATTEATPPRARKSRAGGSAANQPRNRW